MSRLRAAFKRFAYSGLRRDRWQQPNQVVEVLDLGTGDRVADVGAGGGYFTFRVARAVGTSGTVYAVDTDDDLLAWLFDEASAEGLPNIVPIRAQPDEARLPEPVDLILLANVYHHLPDQPSYLKRLAQHLLPGGRVAVLESRPQGLHRVFGHATAEGHIRDDFDAAGYELVAKHDFLAHQSFQIFARRNPTNSKLG
ncbi:MAG: class I SAM-dependent methyltransferase [Actinomycetota bacterium]|nr:class I SAM-dependent methyltransferase [Actinomycetota bacterium]